MESICEQYGARLNIEHKLVAMFLFSDAPFVRTNKVLGATVPGALRSTLVELSLGIGLLGAAAILIMADFVFGPIAAILMCGARFSIYWVWLQTRHTLAATEALFPRSDTEEATCAANLRS
jgi:hypothetical protein